MDELKSLAGKLDALSNAISALNLKMAHAKEQRDEMVSQLRQLKGILAERLHSAPARPKPDLKRPELPEEWRGLPYVEFMRRPNGDMLCRIRIPTDYALRENLKFQRLICIGGMKWKISDDGRGQKIEILREKKEIISRKQGEDFDLPDGAFADGTTRYLYQVKYENSENAFYRVGNGIASKE